MLVIDNAQLFTPSTNQTYTGPHHVIIDNGTIQAIEKGLFQGEAEEVFDAQGKTLAPAFNDSHLHLLRYGLMKKELDLREFTTWAEMKKAMSDSYVEKEMEERDWIVARGLDDSTFTDRDKLLAAVDLDEIEDQYPIFVLHRDGHECILNSKALEIIRHEDLIDSVHPAFIERNEEGEMTGRFKDAAVHFIKFNFRQKTEEEIREALQDAFQHALRYGVTSVHTDDLNYAGDFTRLWKTYTDLELENKLPIKAYLHHYVYTIDDQRKFLSDFQLRSGQGHKHVRMGAFKIFLDGTFRLHTAALRHPYTDVPDTKGVLLYDQATLNEMVKLANDNDMQVTMHAVGDAAVEAGLTAIEQLGNNRMRHRIIHIQVVADDLLKRMRDSRACIEMQFGFLMNEHGEYAEWLGKQRAAYCQLGRSLVDHDIIFTGSSDAPIATLNPLEHIYAGVARQDREGKPEGGFLPREAFTVEEAYASYCATPAYLEFTEREKGKLLPGYAADMVLLSGHPARVKPSGLKDIRVEKVWVDGREQIS